VFDSLQGNQEFIVKLSEQARKKLENGEWHWVLDKKKSGLLPVLKDGAEHWAEQVRIGEKTFRPDTLDSLMSLTQKNNLDALTEKIDYLTDVVEQIAAGQYNDRVAKFYGARQMFLEAISMSDPESQKIALLNAANSANDAIAALQQTIKYDLQALPDVKSDGKLKAKTAAIARCFAVLNDSVQVSVNAYAALGENRSVLAAVRSYQCFMEQSWLAEIHGGKYDGETFAALMHSSHPIIEGADWRLLPAHICESCEAIIETERDTKRALSEALKINKGKKKKKGQQDETV
jgi:hypothetical protein